MLCGALAAPTRAQGNAFAYDASGNVVVRAAAALSPPQIVGQPLGVIAAPGESASFSVVVTDATGVTFQWRFNAANIPGATGDSLVLSNITAGDEGLYSVVVTNGSGSVTSGDAALLLDGDGDGLPDSWEIGSFGNLGQNPTGDADGDGVSNLDEYREGTDPAGSASFRPRLRVTSVGGGTVEVSPSQRSYGLGETVTLFAIPAAPNQFRNWTGDLSGSLNPSGLVLTGHKTVNAIFTYLPPPPGLIAWWRGETDASDAIAGHHGAFVGGATSTPAGQVGGAWSFDGSGYVQVPDAPDLKPALFTAEAWVFPDAADRDPADRARPRLVGR